MSDEQLSGDADSQEQNRHEVRALPTQAAKLPRTSGIYQIRCVANGKVYIGSAVDIRLRWSGHRTDLRHNHHVNPRLQAAWNKYGEDNFEFVILELIPRDGLIQAEQSWIERTNSKNPSIGFNIFDAGTPGDAFVKVWEGFVDPEGNEITITNLQAFCTAHDLDHPSMIRLFQGKSKLKSYKGWTHKNSVRKREYVKTYEGFIDPDGQSVGPITNLAAFCRERGLEKSHMVAVAHGRLCSHQGWTYNSGRRRMQKVHVGFVSPDGQRVAITNLIAFCQEHDLHPVHMHQLKNGQRRSHKGWTWRTPDEQSTQPDADISTHESSHS